MHKTVQNLINIQNLIKSKQSVLENNKIIPKIIAVSKTFKLDHILPLIEHGHIDYGENKVQEALEKWSEIKSNNNKIKLHLIGKLQTNKVKISLKLFGLFTGLISITFVFFLQNIKFVKAAPWGPMIIFALLNREIWSKKSNLPTLIDLNPLLKR